MTERTNLDDTYPRCCANCQRWTFQHVNVGNLWGECAAKRLDPVKTPDAPDIHIQFVTKAGYVCDQFDRDMDRAGS